MTIFEILSSNQDQILAIKMSAYMKGHFPFLGIQKPTRSLLIKDFLDNKKKEIQLDWSFIDYCFGLPQREFHYLAMEYLALVQKKLTPEDLPRLKKLLQTNSWWDSVDTISPIVGSLVLKNTELFAEMKRWTQDKDFWVRRASIIFQLKYKLKTNTDFLQEAILANRGTKEFFINKAIGWALREYSKSNPAFVKEFLKNHSSKLANLSIKEATKYLDK